MTLLYVGLVYAFIPLARPMTTMFENIMGMWLDVSVLLVYLIFFFGTLSYLKFFQKEKRVWPYATVFLIYFLLAYSLNQIHFVAEKVHFLQYAILGTLLIYSLEVHVQKNSNLSKFLLVIGLGFVIGLGDELIQGFFPRRFFDWRDVTMNVFGVGIGVGFAFAIQPQIIIKNEE
jgi:VanZ family protein